MRAQVLLCLVALCCAVEAVAQPAEPEALLWVGVVTGNDVNIRSGPDSNYYAVGRAQVGQQVRVFGEMYGWLKIEPLPGMYSLVDESYVDVTAEGRGIINGDKVRIRAGGELSPQAYAVQVKLDRGAEVTILGQREARLDNKTQRFYQIAPPRGAYLWISADFVQRADAPGAPPIVEHSPVARGASGTVEAAGATPAASAPSTSSSSSGSVPTGGGIVSSFSTSPAPAVEAPAVRSATTEELPSVIATDSGAVFATSTPAPAEAARAPVRATEVTTGQPMMPGGPFQADPRGETEEQKRIRAQLEEAEDALAVEYQKPYEQRDLQSLIARYRPIAEQDAYPLAHHYASARVKQLQDQYDTMAMLKSLRVDDQNLTRVREEAMQVRASIPLRSAPVNSAFDVMGELRPSHVYNSPVLPKRYRLVDPTVLPAKTLAYVEIPPDSTINADPYVGRYVGIYAARKTLHGGTVQAIPLIIPREIVLVEGGPSPFQRPVDEHKVNQPIPSDEPRVDPPPLDASSDFQVITLPSTSGSST